ncbi:hypothetical protein ACF0H5_021653 [Mactra antiquata]
MKQRLLLGLFLLFNMVTNGMGKEDDFFETKIARSLAEASDSITRRDTRDAHAHSHLIQHIIDELHKGHMTSEKLMHWSTEISDALQKGTLTMDEYNEMVQLIRDEMNKTPDECCILG